MTVVDTDRSMLGYRLWVDRQRDRETERESETETERERETEGDRQSYVCCSTKAYKNLSLF